ncbi:recombinase family protein [Pseudomonas sp. MPC6]|uniref:recombinase family protein n=1 Tax=unclassified Pseudomonas TaxID=196821 RepID=UPI00111082CA|nr:recombinase family protein [Pseudomonas sp. MPC6]QCY09847.1 recombinase family protein [Pseudomonas sp. MPC6]
MDIGYVRVSSVDQNEVRQLDGVTLDKVYTDKCSGKDTDRPQLRALLDVVRTGDTVVVHSIDRLARSLSDLLNLVQSLNEQGVSVRFCKENLHFTGADDKYQNLMLQMMGAVAEFERSMIRERQKEGIAQAKLDGKYKGGVKTTDADAIRAHVANGSSYRDTAKSLGVSLSTVQRAMKTA